MWQKPMFVITAAFGCAAFDSALISPRSLIPISMTAASKLLFKPKSVRGRPISLLKLPSVFSVLNRAESTAKIISLVDVLPTEPVTPHNFRLNLSR